jgi:hypothetical protein
MAETKKKGDLAELKVATDLLQKGCRVAFPYGEDCDYDLIIDREGTLERVQVKHATSNGEVIVVQCRSLSLTHGKVKRVKRYTAEMIEWLAVYDCTTNRCYYIRAEELGSGRDVFSLRLTDARNNQRAGIHYAELYLDLTEPRQLEVARTMEPAGFEPATSSVQGKRSPN